ncbi:hypothetical protein M493_15315 [Geobacillus genomosp. 3]|uniref:Uncharacterized protein n=1 Tax=Geobacillus genomosp. 3 TaxID=1921421 RepID=S5Z2L2_GEOG3|nr:hypothetical protein M493_15315 [Geobacillus genomosp. 3]
MIVFALPRKQLLSHQNGSCRRILRTKKDGDRPIAVQYPGELTSRRRPPASFVYIAHPLTCVDK